MSGRLAGVVLALCALAAATAAAEPLALRTELRPRDGAWTGQRVSLYVTVLLPDRPDHSPRFELPEVAGAVFVQAPGSPLLGTERVGSESFTTQRFELLLFPQREGALELPSVGVRVDVGGEPFEGATEAVTVDVRRPPDLPAGVLVLTSDEVSVEQAFEPAPDALTVGDAFVRRVTVTARDLLGIAVPPAPVPRVEGLGVYPGEPTVEDRTGRGRLTGVRTDAITFVCARPGTVVLPDLVYRWWEPRSGRVREQRLPGATFEVGAAPDAAGLDDEASAAVDAAPAPVWPWAKVQNKDHLAIMLIF